MPDIISVYSKSFSAIINREAFSNSTRQLNSTEISWRKKSKSYSAKTDKSIIGFKVIHKQLKPLVAQLVTTGGVDVPSASTVEGSMPEDGCKKKDETTEKILWKMIMCVVDRAAPVF